MTPQERKPVTLPRLRDMHARGEPIAMLTCYDASFARVLDEAGVDCLLVGDWLGMVLQGETSTVPAIPRNSRDRSLTARPCTPSRAPCGSAAAAQACA